MPLSPDECDQIKRETFVAEVAVFDELASTSDYALEQSQAGNDRRPLLVIARRQTRGRGRGANAWWSSEGALTFSLLMDRKSHLPAAPNSPLISLAVGLAVGEALLDVSPGIDIGLKWPNDVYIGRRKIAGILLERPAAAEGDIVIGIGVNVNNSLQTAPAEIADAATSLVDMAQRTHDFPAVLKRILVRLQLQLALLNDDSHSLMEKWRQFCILKGRAIALVAGNRRSEGMCLGVDDDGALLIETSTGVERAIAGSVVSIDD